MLKTKTRRTTNSITTILSKCHSLRHLTVGRGARVVSDGIGAFSVFPHLLVSKVIPFLARIDVNIERKLSMRLKGLTFLHASYRFFPSDILALLLSISLDSSEPSSLRSLDIGDIHSPYLQKLPISCLLPLPPTTSRQTPSPLVLPA